MPLFECVDCGVERRCDWPAATDWPNGILRGVPPDCPECDCPMAFVEDEADKAQGGSAT